MIERISSLSRICIVSDNPRMNFILHRARNFNIALLVAVSSAGALSGAFAVAHADIPRSTTVSYADLDLSSPDDIDAFYRRIQDAARKVCKVRDPILRLYLQVERAGSSCSRLTVAETVAELNIPMLSARHRTATGGPDRR